jgi:hypothetical protein
MQLFSKLLIVNLDVINASRRPSDYSGHSKFIGLRMAFKVLFEEPVALTL